MNLLIKLFIQYPILLFAITVHEYAHGKVAEKFGDDTARVMGRLTLNPVAHMDFLGTVILPLLSIMTGAPLFGWAKPVPVNIYRLTKKQTMFVGLAGSGANFITAGIFSFVFHILKVSNINLEGSEIIFFYGIIINIVLAVFNLVPIPPLDGSKVLSGLLPDKMAYAYENTLNQYGFFLLIFLLATGMLWGILSPIINFLIKLFIPTSFWRFF
ncbi:MAG: site-2 protease family protein [Endomicrobiia bacterium]